MMLWIQRLASLKLTLLGLLMLGAATIGAVQPEQGSTRWLAAPLLLLAINLIAAVATNAVFRRQLPLLVFHLALIALVLLAAIGRLTYFKGTAAITEGASFEGVIERDAGPLHSYRLDEVAFINEGFEIAYKPGPTRDTLKNRVRYRDSNGRERTAEIGDNVPLVLHGYRFYPTANKGFSPVLLWQPAAGQPVLGGIHLPSFPANPLSQTHEWQPPGASEPIWVMLDVPENLIPADRHSRFRLPDSHKIVLRAGDARHELWPGQRLAVAGGSVEYVELRTWMGYHIFYDWTVPWLLASCVLAIASLAWHFWTKFAARPWNREQ